MKNLQFKLALVTMLLSFAFVPVSAYDFKVDDIYYSVLSMSDLTCKVTSGDTKYSGEISIPEQVTYNKRTFNVINIDSSAFKNCSGITSLNIPNSVTSIGDYAFSNCLGLINLTIPNSVTSIGNHAFENCSGITNLSIGNSVTTIGDYAFSNCSGLTNLTIPNSVTSIGNYAFENCSGITNLSIGNSVTTIGDYAFYGCYKLTSLTIPGHVTSIGDNAFSDCYKLTNLNIGINVASIGDYAFYHCYKLTNLNIGIYVTSIGNHAFSGCALKTLTIENGLEKLDLNKTCFSDCPLKSIYLGRNLSSPTFSQKKELTDLTIGSSVTSIGNYAFSGCISLKTLTIEDGVNSLDLYGHCFDDCPLKNIYLGRNLSGTFTFQETKELTDLTIGKNVTKISQHEFYECSALKSIISLAKKAPKAYESTFSTAAYLNATLYVPIGTMDFYKYSTPWKNFLIEENYPTKTEDVKADNILVEKARYSLDGKMLLAPKKGINIIKMSDGTTKKVFVK